MSDTAHLSASPADAIRRSAEELQVLLSGRPPVTALCHENPDGDTIGAAVAMALGAQQLGCRAEVVAADGLPSAYAGLTATVEVRRKPELPPGVAIVCDAATLLRIGSVAIDCADWLAASAIVNVDHHITNSGFGAINLVDPLAAASCEVVAAVLPVLGVKPDVAIASAVLAGIVRDSNGFSAGSTRPETLRAAADAVEAGAPLEATYRATLLEMPMATIRLWGRLLSSVEQTSDARIAYAVLRLADLQATGTEQHDAEGIAEFLMRGAGVDIGILFRDLGSETRVSLRTSESIDAARIASLFGGGGHSRRAGWTEPQPAEVAVPRIVERCHAEMG